MMTPSTHNQNPSINNIFLNMPADNSLSQEPTAKTHSDGDAPYQCSRQDQPPGPRGAKWAIDYGYCRTSLDYQPPHYRQGSSDPRCPDGCKHKASQYIAMRFADIFEKSGARKAAEFTKNHKEAWENE